ncbi:hypothetical protein [Brevundimonas aurantiaca]|uniref:hypothetical protein n=1 Tax=Brevundimonas aurantiaca TaxID=74316 RepID=UPI002FDD3F41
MKLSAAHPLDVLELAWGLEIRNSFWTPRRLAVWSGRSEDEWRAAFETGSAHFPPTEVIDERQALVRRGVAREMTAADLSKQVRAPLAWCAEAARRAAATLLEETADEPHALRL